MQLRRRAGPRPLGLDPCPTPGVGAGATDGRGGGPALPRMLRCHLVLLVVVTIALLFDHLVEGVVDAPAFALSPAQLLAAGTGGLTHGSQSGAASRRRGARRRGALSAFLWASNACLILDVVFSALCVVGGVSLDLAAKVALLLFVTSLPFFALDRELAASRSELTFVSKIWTIEAVDFCTILYGAIATGGRRPPRSAAGSLRPPRGL